MSYAQILRVIGQTLERLSVDSFRISRVQDGFVVQELPTIEEIQSGEPQNSRPDRMNLNSRKFHYTYRDIEQLDRRESANRLEAEGLPDPESLSNMLRAAGTHVDLKGGHLIGFTKTDDKSLEIRYETDGGGVHKEMLDAADLYSLFVRVYLKRADRSRWPMSQP